MTQFTEIFQPELWFFRPDDSPPSKEVRTQWADPENPDNPLHSFIGNQHAVRRLCRVAFEVFGRHNRECGDHAFALVGPPSTGKAMLAHLFAELLCLPFVEIDAQSCNDLNDIAIAIARVLENTRIEHCQYPTLELQELGGGRLVVPPCIVFIDGIENLPKKIAKQLFAGRLETNGWKFDRKRISRSIRVRWLARPPLWGAKWWHSSTISRSHGACGSVGPLASASAPAPDA